MARDDGDGTDSAIREADQRREEESDGDSDSDHGEDNEEMFAFMMCDVQPDNLDLVSGKPV